jgi:CubicO group peptidase (beta-lactamase class C family)
MIKLSGCRIHRSARGACAAAILLFLSLTARTLAGQAAAGLPPGAINRIERAVTAAMSRDSIPGLSVAVVAGRELRWSNGYGLADLENFVPAQVVHRVSSGFRLETHHGDGCDAAGRTRQARS